MLDIVLYNKFRYNSCTSNRSRHDRYLQHHLGNCPWMNACRLYWWLLNIGQGNVLVPADNKPLLEPMLTKFYDTLLCQQAPISYHVDGNIYTIYAEKQTRKMHHLRHGRVYFSISACISSRVNLSVTLLSLLWRHNGRDVVSNHQTRNCLLNRLFRRRSKKASKHPVTGLCAGNSPVTDEFPAQMASNAENVSIWWRCHVFN